MDKKYSIQDLVDIERLRELFENFSKATGFTTGFVTYPSQELLITTGWRDICTKFHRACPASAECCKESNVYLTACLKDLKGLSIKPCGNGLVDGATPVIIQGVHLASLATGQVLLAPPDIAFFKRLAAKYGYDTDEYLAALAKVPIVTEETLKNALIFLGSLAVQIAEEGLHKLQIQKTSDELRKAKAEVDRKVEKRTLELQKSNEQLQVELAERQRAEDALGKREAQYSAIVEAFDGIIYICSKDYRVEFINQRGIQRCGHNPVGELCYKALHDLKAVCPWCMNERVFEGETARWEVQSPKDNRWYYVVNTPLCHPDGTVSKQAMILDITERKRAEDALRESEMRFRSVLESSLDCIYRFDLQTGRYEYISPSADNVAGFSADELLAMDDETAFAMVHPDDMTALQAALTRLDETGVEEVEYRQRTKHGDYRWLSNRLSLTRDSDSRPLYRSGNIRDITERKLAEDEYKTILRTAMDGFYIVDLEGRILETNHSYCSMIGYSREELIKMSINDIDAIDTEEVIKSRIQQIMETGQVRFETKHRRKDGGIIVIEASCNFLEHEKKRLFVFMRDITERKHAEQSLQEAQAQLQAHAENLEKTVAERTARLWEQTAERDHLQRELLKISEREKQLIAQELHDGLCQHLAGTAMMTSLLHRSLAARQAPEADQAQEVCELLSTGVLEARNLSHGLHPVKDKGEGLMESLTGLAQKVTNLFHIQCAFCCDGAVLINSQTTATQLFRIAQEATNNAIKHGQAGKVRINLKNENGGVTLSIRDNGIGIPDELPATKGMGLQIMNHGADVIGAVLSIRRAGKRGTVVTCMLPARI